MNSSNEFISLDNFEANTLSINQTRSNFQQSANLNSNNIMHNQNAYTNSQPIDTKRYFESRRNLLIQKNFPTGYVILHVLLLLTSGLILISGEIIKNRETNDWNFLDQLVGIVLKK